MAEIDINGRVFLVDEYGFLENFSEWSEEFARAVAPQCGIEDGLTDQHWKVIYYIRQVYEKYGSCPLFYKTCKGNDISLKKLQTLFPTGYQRGACRLAGAVYRQVYHSSGSPPHLTRDDAAAVENRAKRAGQVLLEKVYRVDVNGFLVDPTEWDEHFCIQRANELKMPPLTPRHWEIISFVRDKLLRNGTIPTVYETCEFNHLDIDEFARLFPDGYHRGVIKIAGLRLPV